MLLTVRIQYALKEHEVAEGIGLRADKLQRRWALVIRTIRPAQCLRDGSVLVQRRLAVIRQVIKPCSGESVPGTTRTVVRTGQGKHPHLVALMLRAGVGLFSSLDELEVLSGLEAKYAAQSYLPPLHHCGW